MLCEASVGEVQRQRLTKSQGRLVVCMRHYPRFLRRTLCHDYERGLSPSPELFSDFRAALARGLDHNQAFEAVGYEERFDLEAPARARLHELSELSRSRDVFLICQCERGEKCHRHLLLLYAQALWNAPIDRVRLPYPIFSARLAKLGKDP